MDKKYIFRMDKTYTGGDEDRDLLDAHDGKECFANLDNLQSITPISTLPIRFPDGFTTEGFVYELEEVHEP
jgi:hypothetical protein